MHNYTNHCKLLQVLVFLLILSASSGINCYAQVATVTVTPDPANVILGAKQTFKAVARNANGSIVKGTATWAVIPTGDAIGTITTGGSFTATAVGTGVIQATIGGVTGTANITVLPKVGEIIVTPNPVQVLSTRKISFKAEVRDPLGRKTTIKPTWSVQNNGAENIGAINSSGSFTANEPGTGTVVAAAEGVTGAANVTVLPLVGDIVVTPSPANALMGTKVNFKASVIDSLGGKLSIKPTWSVISDGAETIGTINPSGQFTPTALGTGLVVAQIGDVVTQVPITVRSTVATVEITPEGGTLEPGQALQFTVTARDAQGNVVKKPATWSVISDGATIGAVNASGKFTATNSGTGAVKATVLGVSDQVDVLVKNITVQSVQVTPKGVILFQGQKQQYTAVVKDDEGNTVNLPVSWSVIPEEGITAGSISANGLFTASKAGVSKIRATCRGVQDETDVAVINPNDNIYAADYMPKGPEDAWYYVRTSGTTGPTHSYSVMYDPVMVGSEPALQRVTIQHDNTSSYIGFDYEFNSFNGYSYFGWDEALIGGAFSEIRLNPALSFDAFIKGTAVNRNGIIKTDGADSGLYNVSAVWEKRETVVTGAGTFEQCAVVKLTQQFGSEFFYKRLWLAFGIGAVKEVDYTTNFATATATRTLLGAKVSGVPVGNWIDMHDYFPMAVGNRTVLESGGNVIFDKTFTGTTTFNGITSWIWNSEESNMYWYETAAGIELVGEQNSDSPPISETYEPRWLYPSAPVGAVIKYTGKIHKNGVEDGAYNRQVVIEGIENVVIPNIGTFENCVKIVETLTTTGSEPRNEIRTLWFSPSAGLVKMSLNDGSTVTTGLLKYAKVGDDEWGIAP